MEEFFRGQYDYIYFFYGLAFFFLALICFSMGARKPQRLPWIFLGLFGFVHAITEWLKIYIMNVAPLAYLSSIERGTVALSYLFLFEFARRGFLHLFKRTFWARSYLLLFALVFWSGHRFGPNGFNVASRYLLGFPAGLLSCWLIYKTASFDTAGRKQLVFLSIVIGLYAFATALDVPKVEFGLAKWLNFDSFYHSVKVPLQLVRGILALLSSITIWFYSQTSSAYEYRAPRYNLRFRPSKWVIVFTFIIVIALGWLFTNYLDHYAGIQTIKNSKIYKNSGLNRLVRELTIMEQAAIAIGKSNRTINALALRNEEDMQKTQALLAQYQRRVEALDCYLLDINGAVILSTAGKLPGGPSDKAYAVKPYFKQALRGDSGYYFDLGTDYNERTYYVSFPVRDASGKISGVVVVTKNISVKPVLQYRLLSISITLFISILAMFFFIAWARREGFLQLIGEANRRLQEVDNMKTDFISVVSHELRTPLTSIKNATTILLKGGPAKRSLGPEEKELLEIILNNTNRQTRMVSDLLDISKIEAGVMDTCLEYADIVRLSKEVIENLKGQAEEKQISLSLDAPKEPLIVRMDTEHTRRVFDNLIVNAIKFTPEHGKIGVKLEDNEKQVKVTVNDTGIGIPSHGLTKLFNKFYRAPDANARQKGGSGLGLVISKGLIEAQGGGIGVESELGKGSSFYFTLPLLGQEKGDSNEKKDTHN